LVFTVPQFEKERYYSLQCIDMYTFNFGYIGSRATGNDAGSYLIAGPDWKREKPPGIRQLIPCETQFAFVLYRTQLFKPDDIENVKRLQAGYKVQPLSAFLGTPPPPAAPAIDFIKPLSPQEEKTSPEFFNILNFVLQFCPTHPSETEVRARFAKLGIRPGERFDAEKLSPEIRKAVENGMADAWKAFAELKEKQLDTGKLGGSDMVGNRETLKNNYLYRFAVASLGIYGNSPEEAFYPPYFVDAAGGKLTGANRYTLHFPPNGLPPVNAFWSVTMYEMPASLLYANPLNRYLINSTMLPDLKKDADGGLTIYVQHESPGKEKEANWLPAPSGPLFMAMRLYWPKPEALDGRWKAPPLQKVTDTKGSKP
jgi:hypothetical protein